MPEAIWDTDNGNIFPNNDHVVANHYLGNDSLDIPQYTQSRHFLSAIPKSRILMIPDIKRSSFELFNFGNPNLKKMSNLDRRFWTKCLGTRLFIP